jgi:iron complex transport system substrate-binding protein
VKSSSLPGLPRIVSLAPSATSILCALGAKKALVGVTKWCADVAPVNGLPRLGDCWHMNSVDEILRLRPTLVVGSVPYHQPTVAKLLDQPLTFLAMNPRSLADIDNDIRILGRLVNRAEAAERVIRQMRKGFASIEKQTPHKRRRARFYCEAWPNPRISSPPWVAELVEIAGGKMAVPAGCTVTDEQVAAADPEVMVLSWAATGKKSRPQMAYQVERWKDVTAIRERRVYVISDELLNTPGPPLLRGARELAKLIRTLKAPR